MFAGIKGQIMQDNIVTDTLLNRRTSHISYRRCWLARSSLHILFSCLLSLRSPPLHRPRAAALAPFSVAIVYSLQTALYSRLSLDWYLYALYWLSQLCPNNDFDSWVLLLEASTYQSASRALQLPYVIDIHTSISLLTSRHRSLVLVDQIAAAKPCAARITASVSDIPSA